MSSYKNEITPFVSETAVVITDKAGNELNFEFWEDEITVYGKYQATGLDDKKIESIEELLTLIYEAVKNLEVTESETKHTAKVTGKTKPLFNLNFTAYCDEGNAAQAIEGALKNITELKGKASKVKP